MNKLKKFLDASTYICAIIVMGLAIMLMIVGKEEDARFAFIVCCFYWVIIDIRALKKTENTTISEEKRLWMEEVGMKEFSEPMKYHHKFGGLYSEEFIKNTTLEKLKEGYEKTLPVDHMGVKKDENQ